MKCRKHKWAPLVASVNGKTVPTSLFVCLRCGQLKIGKRTIRISKYRIDMGGGQIKNASAIYATSFYGTVYYGHLYFKEKKCPFCHKIFSRGDRIILVMVEKKKEGIGLVPCHLNCFKDYGV